MELRLCVCLLFGESEGVWRSHGFILWPLALVTLGTGGIAVWLIYSRTVLESQRLDRGGASAGYCSPKAMFF